LLAKKDALHNNIFTAHVTNIDSQNESGFNGARKEKDARKIRKVLLRVVSRDLHPFIWRLKF